MDETTKSFPHISVMGRGFFVWEKPVSCIVMILQKIFDCLRKWVDEFEKVSSCFFNQADNFSEN